MKFKNIISYLAVAIIMCFVVSAAVYSGTITKGKLTKSDIALWTGTSCMTWERETSAGYSLVLPYFDYQGVDVFETYGGGVNADAATLQSALDAIEVTNDRVIWMSPAPQRWDIDANVTIPTNVTMQVPPGCDINIHFGFTLTVSSPDHIKTTGRYQIKSGTGTLAFTNQVGRVEAYWWGLAGDDTTDDTAALRAALAAAAGGTLHIPEAASRFRITNYLEVSTDNTRIICEWNKGAIRQDTWGLPVFYGMADDVTIVDPWLFSNEAKAAIGGDMATTHAGEPQAAEGTLDALEFSAGIFFRAHRVAKGSRLNINRWHVEGFANGIFCVGSTTAPGVYIEDVYLGSGTAKTVDWGIKAAVFENLVIDSINAVDVDETQGHEEHIIYITGGNQTYPGKGLSIGQITGRNINNGAHPISIKYTENFSIGSIAVQDCGTLINVAYLSNGAIGQITGLVDNSSGGNALVYTFETSDVAISSLYIEGPFYDDQVVAVDLSSQVVISSPYIRQTGGTEYADNLFYSAGSSQMRIHNPVVDFENTDFDEATEYVFWAATDARMTIINPEVMGLGALCHVYYVHALADIAGCYLSLNPKLIDIGLVVDSLHVNGDTGPFNFDLTGETSSGVALTTADATPAVGHATYFTITNAGAQNITDFHRSPAGHRFTIEASGDANTTFVHAANQLETFDAGNCTLADGKCIEFVERGGCFYETWRSI